MGLWLNPLTLILNLFAMRMGVWGGQDRLHDFTPKRSFFKLPHLLQTVFFILKLPFLTYLSRSISFLPCTYPKFQSSEKIDQLRSDEYGHLSDMVSKVPLLE